MNREYTGGFGEEFDAGWQAGFQACREMQTLSRYELAKELLGNYDNYIRIFDKPFQIKGNFVVIPLKVHNDNKARYGLSRK